jgi:hypothetical protein
VTIRRKARRKLNAEADLSRHLKMAYGDSKNLTEELQQQLRL